LDALITSILTDFNLVRTTAFALTPAQAALINEAPGLINDPVLGPGTPSLSALNIDWEQFFKAHFETTQMSLILTFQQSLDRRRAEGFVQRLRLFSGAQDPVVFNLNQIY
jgi:hypothetical protein